MNKKILFLLCLILFIVSVAGVSATEDINQIDINTNDLVSGEDTSGVFLSYSEIQGSSGAGTFSDLQTIINEAEEGSIINLTMNYSFNSSVDTGSITIAKQLTIDGNGYTINGNNESGAFHVSYNHVALKNIEFSDCFSKYGGAVRWSGDDGAVFNCSFIKNTASYGGAIFQESDNLIITNNRFIQNSAESGGAICSIGQITLNNVTFISNNAGLVEQLNIMIRH